MRSTVHLCSHWQHLHNILNTISVSLQVTPRENRIYKLYRDLQHIRQRRDGDGSYIGSISGHVTERSLDSDTEDMNDPDFLLMSYEDLDSPLRAQKSNKALDDFLYGSLKYDLCSKGRPLHAGRAERKDKALTTLKQKLGSKPVVGAKVSPITS